MLDQLTEDSEAGIPLLRSQALVTAKPSKEDVDALRAAVLAKPDYRSYHALFALRRHARATYDSIPNTAKAEILGATLGRVQFLNDFGYLEPSGSHDDEAAIALLELGRDALPSLVSLLQDDRPAPLYGSETATLSTMYQYRRKDFAYRYAALIRGEQAAFDPSPVVRDRAIAALAAALSTLP